MYIYVQARMCGHQKQSAAFAYISFDWYHLHLLANETKTNKYKCKFLRCHLHKEDILIGYNNGIVDITAGLLEN